MTAKNGRPMPAEFHEHYDDVSACGRCGFCQPTCPIFRATGREGHVARGKLALFRNIVEGRSELTAETKDAFSNCLLCRACAGHLLLRRCRPTRWWSRSGTPTPSGSGGGSWQRQGVPRPAARGPASCAGTRAVGVGAPSVRASLEAARRFGGWWVCSARSWREPWELGAGNAGRATRLPAGQAQDRGARRTGRAQWPVDSRRGRPAPRGLLDVVWVQLRAPGGGRGDGAGCSSAWAIAMWSRSTTAAAAWRPTATATWRRRYRPGPGEPAPDLGDVRPVRGHRLGVRQLLRAPEGLRSVAAGRS